MRKPFFLGAYLTRIHREQRANLSIKKSQTHSKRKPNNPTIYSQHKKTATTEGLIELNIQKTQKNQTHFKPRFNVNLPPFRDQ